MNLRRAILSQFAGALLLAGAVQAAPLDEPIGVDLSGAVGNGLAVAAAVAAARAPGARPAQPETVKFSGAAAVTGRVLRDPVLNTPPVLELVIDLTRLVGIGGGSGRTYVSSGVAVVHRPLQATDVVQVTFPFYVDGDPATARTGLATLNVTYSDFAGLNITGTLGTPSF